MPVPMEKKDFFSLMDEYMATKGPALGVNQVMEYDLRDRMVRVEEAIKNQTESFSDKFDMMNKRFDDTLAFMEKRFEQVDKRFEQVDKRFEQVDKRFEQVDKRFEQVDKRFEQVDKRFETMQSSMDKRFEDMNLRFGEQNANHTNLIKRMDRFMFVSFSATFSAAGLVIAAMNFFF